MQLEQAYRLRFGQNADYRDQVWRIVTADYFQQYVPTDSKVLDLGAGWGEFIRNIRAGKKFAMDLNPETAVRVGPDVTFLHQDCSKEWGLSPNTLDLVFTSNFFEHLPTKELLCHTLGQAFDHLRPGGRLICLGPNIRCLPGSYWDFWDHYLPLSDRSLKEGLLLAGFEIEQVIARFLPYSMSNGFNPPASLLKLYLRLPVIWRFVGKQFLVIGRKP